MFQRSNLSHSILLWHAVFTEYFQVAINNMATLFNDFDEEETFTGFTQEERLKFWQPQGIEDSDDEVLLEETCLMMEVNTN